MIPENVFALSCDLRNIQKRYGLKFVLAGMEDATEDGRTLFLQWTGDILEIERDDGEMVLLDGRAIERALAEKQASG